jgi:uncharacterized membrane protein YdjX (TVP38/TMEM64 family)
VRIEVRQDVARHDVARQDPAGGDGPPDVTDGRPLTRLVTSSKVRIGLLLLLLGAAVAMGLAADDVSIAGLREVAAAAGPVAPVGYALVYALAATLLVPAAPLTVAAGVVFGPGVGVLTALAGATLGSLGAFGLGRVVGRGAVEDLAGGRLAGVDAFLARRGFAAVLLLRLVPLFPFNVINLVSGVTGLRVREYALATAVGIVPGTVVYAALGGTIDDPTSPAFLATLAAFVALTLAAGLTARRLRERGDVPGT